MEKLKNLLPGHSDDKAKAEANTSQPSGKLTGEATHLDRANMPGSWQDEAAPSYEATKGTGISSNPSTVPFTDETSYSKSTEATRGSGISSSIGDHSNASATGSRATPQAGHNPDALAAASSALGATTAGVTSASQPSSTSRVTSTSAATQAPSTSHRSATGSSTADIGTPIADTFTGTPKPSGTEYVGGSAPGVAGQSVTREAPFSTSSPSNAGRDHSSSFAAGAAGATAGGLTSQALTDQSRPAEGTSATISPSYTERSQPLSGTSAAAKPIGTGTPATNAGFGSTTSHAEPSSSPSSGTKISKPFASDPVSTEPLGSSSTSALGSGGLASQGTSHYTGDSRDYSSSTRVSGAGVATGAGSGSATSGAYTGGPAPGVSGQSTTSAAPELTSSSDRGNTSAGLATGAAAGAIGAGGIAAATHDSSKVHHSTVGSSSTASDFNPNASTPGTSVAGSPQQSTDKTPAGVGYGDQYNRLSGGTPSGIAVSDPARGNTADRTTGTSSTTAPNTSSTTAGSDHHYGRDAAGVAGLGAAGGLAGHELGKDRDATNVPSQGSYNVSSSQAYLGSGAPETTTTGSSKPYEVGGTPAAYTKQAPQYATPAPLSSTSQGESTTGKSHLGRDTAIAAGVGAGTAGVYGATKQHDGSATALSSTDATSTTKATSTGGYGDQYNRLSDGTPSGIATSDPAFPSSGTAGGTTKPSTTGQHHYGRDAALGGTGATALAGTGATMSSTSGNKPSDTSSSGYGDQYNRLSDGTPSGIATSDPVHKAVGSTSTDSQPGLSNEHHYGRDAAMAGTAAAATGAGAAAYGGSSSSHTAPTGTATSTSGGYGDQYGHLKDGTPSGIAVSDPATKNVLPSSTQSQHATSDQHHYGRDAAIGGAGVAGAGAAAYGLSEHEKKAEGVPGTSTPAGTHSSTLQEGSAKPSALTTESRGSGQRESLEEPDSPTGTGETKKKRGFLSKILHRDDPNKLHKESKESRKSLEAESAEIPRTTRDAYSSNIDGGKTSHFGTDGEIGRGGQAISGFGHQDARQALPLREAEKLEHSAGGGAGHSGHQ